MEDPWAAGPSWTPRKPQFSEEEEQDESRQRTSTTFTPPPATATGGFDGADPWGAASGPKKLPGEDVGLSMPTRVDETEEGGWGVEGGVGGSREEHERDEGWGGGSGAGSGTAALHLVGVPRQPRDGGDGLEDAGVGAWGAEDAEANEVVEPGPEADQSVEKSLDGDATHAPLEHPPDTSDSVDLSSPIRSPSSPTKSPRTSPTPLPVPLDAGFASHPSPPPFGADLSPPNLPKSPSFGDEGFGGFATSTAGGFESSDPWGTSLDAGGSGWGGAGGDLPRFGSGDVGPGVDTRDDEEEGGWGPVRPGLAIPLGGSEGDERVPGGRDDEEDWEEVQRKIRLQQERMPREKVERLRDSWKEVVLGLVVEKLEAMSEEEERKLSEGVKKVEADSYETLRSLSTIPSDINTYPPVISSLITHERHIYALSRPNPTPSTSLLSLSLTRRPRRIQNLDTDSPWLSRSKLGEPDAPVEEAVQSPETSAGGSKWSFWRKPTIERQLTTSGGGILEVRSPSAPTFSRTSSDIKVGAMAAGSRAGSVAGQGSRAASPAPSTVAATTTPTSTTFPASYSEGEFGHPAPSGLVDSTSTGTIPASHTPAPTAPAPAPSAVSRFFGRLGRKTPAPSTDGKIDTGDLELSADDFTFLSEVPGLAPADPGVGDLLSMESGRGEQMASLESMLNSKPSAIPAPLAPPPRGMARNPSASGAFVPRMKAPTATIQRGPSDMDLLGGLDFDSPTTMTTTTMTAGSSSTPPPPPPIQKSPPSGTTHLGSMWDDFLAPTVSAGPSMSKSSSAVDLGSPATLAGPSRSSAQLGQETTRGQSSSTFSLSPPRAIAPPIFPPAASSSLAPPSDDFDDFGTPQKGSVAQFDDFDFGSFETPGSKRQVPPAGAFRPLGQPSQHQSADFGAFDFSSFDRPMPSKPALATPGPKANHQPRSSLDHTPTISLMSGASAQKGRRWPAPPSPIAPVLEPPPRSTPGGSSTGGFPFLSPPPPGRATPTRGMDLLSQDAGDAAGAPLQQQQQKATSGLGSNMSQGSSQSLGQGLMPAATPPPQRAGSPLVPASSGMKKQETGGRGGLSSADLSFFDNL